MRLFKDIIDHSAYAYNISRCEIKAWKNPGLYRIRNHDLCDTVAVLQLSYEANWELATLWARNIPLENKEHKWIYEISYIWTAKNDMKITIDDRTCAHNLSSCEIRA